jgi:hypothetical protein
LVSHAIRCCGIGADYACLHAYRGRLSRAGVGTRPAGGWNHGRRGSRSPASADVQRRLENHGRGAENGTTREKLYKRGQCFRSSFQSTLSPVYIENQRW